MREKICSSSISNEKLSQCERNEYNAMKIILSSPTIGILSFE